MDFYFELGSPPCASAQMIAEALNLKMNVIRIDLEKGEHMTKEFLKLNPLHTVPTIVDNGFALGESRAIGIYLVEKYGGEDNSLYPSDVQTRATINQRLYFDHLLYDRFIAYYYAFYYGKEPSPEDLRKLGETVEILEKFLEGHEFIAGTKTFTIADVFLYASVGCFGPVGFSLEPYTNVTKWFENMKKVAPGKEVNEKYKEAFCEFVKQ